MPMVFEHDDVVVVHLDGHDVFHVGEALPAFIKLELLSDDGEELTPFEERPIQGGLALESPESLIEVRANLRLGEYVGSDLEIPGQKLA